ncbi:MAG: ATP-dependent Clp protease proteolytic subunit [Deltaproteobacteria bacterium]|nr:ATP-dependent Clp protease proteolytic subunit [Deltaproteobacteria bacterium]
MAHARKQPMTAARGDKDDESGKVAERLLKSRTILLSSEVSPTTARKIIEQILVLEADDPEKPITLLVNSPGGEVHSGFAIYDVIRFVRPRVRIVCVGLTASIATVILLAATREDRLALPNARLLIHQPLFQGEVFGPASDLEITAQEILKTKRRINELIAEETGRPLDKVEKDTERDYWLSADEAQKYGLVARVITERAEIER